MCATVPDLAWHSCSACVSDGSRTAPTPVQSVGKDTARRMGGLGLDGKGRWEKLLTVRANHSQIAKPRAALILKNSLRNTPQEKIFAGSVQGSCLTFSPVLCGCWVGASQQHMVSMVLYWPASRASESL